MSAPHEVIPLELRPMPQLAQAVHRKDDWTGVTNRAERKKRQVRLNVRAYRQRQALKLKDNADDEFTSTPPDRQYESLVPCWNDALRTVTILPSPVAHGLYKPQNPLVATQPTGERSQLNIPPSQSTVFPLCPDHLITLLQFNTLRASIENRRLLQPLDQFSLSSCSTSELRILPTLVDFSLLPPSLVPTELQCSIPHEDWVDIVPHPRWRDNMLRALGKFDEDELWSDTIGGLFEGFPDSEIEHRGVIIWSTPWDVRGWEISQGFWEKWRWTLHGCGDIIEATNHWRKIRGETPLVGTDLLCHDL